MQQIRFNLVNRITGREITVTVNDHNMPSQGYTQAYADQYGQDYASQHAPEVLGGEWKLLKAKYIERLWGKPHESSQSKKIANRYPH